MTRGPGDLFPRERDSRPPSFWQAEPTAGAEPDAEALSQVRALGAHDGVLLVCFEADGRCCHRTEVLHALNAARLAA